MHPIEHELNKKKWRFKLFIFSLISNLDDCFPIHEWNSHQILGRLIPFYDNQLGVATNDFDNIGLLVVICIT